MIGILRNTLNTVESHWTSLINIRRSRITVQGESFYIRVDYHLNWKKKGQERIDVLSSYVL